MTIEGWLGEGGEREDDAVRFLRHFHDPLRPLDEAGFSVGPLQFSSSIDWMHASSQDWSWPAARRLYYQALTEPDPVRRDELWSDLFRALGHIMHLVVDASVPEHTRNDMHPLGAMKVESSYEDWVSNQHAASPAHEAEFIARFLSAPIGFTDALFASEPDGEPREGVSTAARLLDADRYDGTNASVTVGGHSRAPVGTGLAEIANANFFSEDTLRGQYPSPSDHGLIPVNLVTPLGKVRRYFSRPDGLGLLPANPLRAECASQALGFKRVPYPCVDALVWNQVAMHMLPRAVGYARGVLDYFFRGSLRVSRVTVNAPVSGPDVPGETGVWIEIQNTSAERLEGRFEAYARYHRDTASERRLAAATINDGASVAIDPGHVARLRLTALAAPSSGYYVLVFRGRLGSEDDAVIGQIFAVPHVQPIQTTYDAEVSRSCTTVNFSGSDVPVGQRMHCSWQPIHHRAYVRLQTNLEPAAETDPDEPVIERIRAYWTGGVPGAARVIVEGVEYADGMWERTGVGANPSDLLITDPGVRGDSNLHLQVWVRGTESPFTTQLATFKAIAHESAEKRVQGLWNAGKWMLYSRRIARVPLAFNQMTHVARSIGGFPSPTPLTLGETLSTVPFIARDFLEVTATLGVQWAISDFAVIPITSDTNYQAAFDAIRLDAPWPTAPAMHWAAEVFPREWSRPALDFWRMFVSGEEPARAPIVMTGREPAH